MKRILLVCLVILMMLGTASAQEIPQVAVTFNGQDIDFPDAKPYIDSNYRTMVPLRFISYALGADVAWEQEKNEIIICHNEDRLRLIIGQQIALVNDQPVQLDTAVVTKQDRAFVPLRFVSEMLGMNIKWNGHTRTVEMTTPDYIPPEPQETKITVSIVGDCTLGSDLAYGYANSFVAEVAKQKYDYGYFFSHVKDIFAADDLTIANLETTFTHAEQPADKKFRFKGDPAYVNILKQGNIEAVNIANNHIHDYLEKGYNDTLQALKNGGIGYFGYANRYVATIKGIRIGMLGYTGWNNSQTFKNQLKKDITTMREEADLVLVSFHWGKERMNIPNAVQKDLGRFAVDVGADLVFGHHPHVIQGIEKYKGKRIAYSLGNFCFGGNRNPIDKDTYIYQETFTFNNRNQLTDSQIHVIPCSISSVKNRNDYRPTPLAGPEKERVLKRIF